MSAIIESERLRGTAKKAGSSNILAVDIGGTLIKAAVVDPAGTLVSEFVTTPTPKPAPPEAVIDLLARVAEPLPPFGCISVGFPGVVYCDRIETAPNLGTPFWRNFDLAGALHGTFGAPVRILNDAVVYGLGVATGPGRECVLTFGTGMGCALFSDGTAFFGLELGQHRGLGDGNYDQYVGHAAYLEIGLEAWNERAKRVIETVQALTNSDRMYLGGGNSRRITFPLPPWATVVVPSSGVAGGARLWHRDMDRFFQTPSGSKAGARQ
ncbi:ROK family protein [Hyphomicrobium methylovorum]|uniref:ROK family protein n=1 Tax=Hyphomicrobium methylovorum TaxID=84 RepID=UPI0015E6FFA1|nr:ROK family protein [Hyphomicrobium methylovorum]MBA2127615.1 ROK family protein [Hyphomicrobium methylovorum]